jgi:dTDP-4-amino-4,6-dideoxygalactose transaminase
VLLFGCSRDARQYPVRPMTEVRGSRGHLRAHSIVSVFHYTPLHLSGAGLKFATGPSNCPVTEGVSERLVRLPFYNDLSEGEQDQVTSAVTSSCFPFDDPACQLDVLSKPLFPSENDNEITSDLSYLSSLGPCSPHKRTLPVAQRAYT